MFFYWKNGVDWDLAQSNYSVSPGSIVYWTYTQANSYNTTYYWKVVVRDIYDNESSFIYHFTTIDQTVNQSPVISNPSPANNSIDQNLSLIFSVDINDPEGDTFNWTIECNNGQSNSSNDDTNGTKTLELTGLSYGTVYRVWVNATDSGSNNWTRVWYQFTTLGGLKLYCYNESNPSQAINFDIQISNYEGTQVYTATGLSNGAVIPLDQVPYGENTVILVSSNGYKSRTYYVDLYQSNFYNLTFYLPPETTQGTGNQTTKTLRSFTNAVTITNTSQDVTIPFTHTPESIIGVYIYNNSIYGGWITVPDDKYTYNDTQVVINYTALDNNSTMAKVEYYYWYTQNVTEETPLFVLQVINPYEQPVKNAKVLIKRYINTTEGYENVTSLLTDGYGKASAYLIPDTLYKVFINKTGYQQEIADWIPTTEEASTAHIFRLEFSFNISINQTIFMIINISVGWTSNTTFYIHYDDVSNNTNSITFRVYSINGTLLYTHTVSNNSYNFTYNNANNTKTYLYQIEINNSLWSTNQTINGIIYPAGQKPLITTTSLEDLLERFLGFTPFVNPSTGVSVNWVYAIVAIIGIVILLSFGYYNAHIGLIGCGLWFNLAFILISGLTIILPGIGTLLVVMGILFAIGGAIK
ncbi:MAG: hypothetical protein DRN16_02405 [Thermoplasmata archaeon]|nr:MAG: hypothetical protein DRN16_02405 [Thermoplasmata archaeon]